MMHVCSCKCWCAGRCMACMLAHVMPPKSGEPCVCCCRQFTGHQPGYGAEGLPAPPASTEAICRCAFKLASASMLVGCRSGMVGWRSGMCGGVWQTHGRRLGCLQVKQ